MMKAVAEHGKILAEYVRILAYHDRGFDIQDQILFE